jgi:hypothetical protein
MSEKNDGKVENNPSALRGDLNVIIDTLVFYCHLLKLDNHNSQSERFKLIERIFISQVFNQLNHKEYIELTKKHANMNFITLLILRHLNTIT